MKILLGITGGIAAYKSCELCRLFVKNGDSVKVVMTEHAKQFIHPNTFAALSGNEVYSDCFENPMVHIELAKWADQIIIAPATANTIAKLNYGLADDLLSTICLAAETHITLAPAMNKIMWQNESVQQNLLQLKQKDFKIIEPTAGEQACGDIGIGRMAEPVDIYNHFAIKPLLKDLTVLISAGPTREKIDPIRYLSNFSSGKMGYALATAAKRMGAKVVLISGPTCLEQPQVNTFVSTESANDMLQTILEYIHQADIFISAAAVADYTPANTTEHKIKKDGDDLILALKRTKDILTTLNTYKNIFKVGFCAETDNLLENAKAKLVNKGLDVIIANLIASDGYPMGADSNELIFMTKDTNIHLEKASKSALAQQVLELIAREVQ
jgi:phosphopantothenoylcysteine decarboxylase/phosphopantothenate--cysteine ligase